MRSDAKANPLLRYLGAVTYETDTNELSETIFEHVTYLLYKDTDKEITW